MNQDVRKFQRQNRDTLANYEARRASRKLKRRPLGRAGWDQVRGHHGRSTKQNQRNTNGERPGNQARIQGKARGGDDPKLKKTFKTNRKKKRSLPQNSGVGAPRADEKGGDNKKKEKPAIPRLKSKIRSGDGVVGFWGQNWSKSRKGGKGMGLPKERKGKKESQQGREWSGKTP